MSYFEKEKLVILVITITGLVYNIGMAAGPYFEGRLAQCLYDIIKGISTQDSMKRLVIIYVTVIIGVQAARALKRYYVRVFANNISRDMRRVLYNSLVHMDEKQIEEEQLGSLMTKAVADVDACSEGMRKFTTEIFDTGIVMAVYLFMLAAIDWKLTILAGAFTPLAYIIANGLKKQVSSANSEYKDSASILNQVTMDRVSNSITYRMFGREDDRNRAYEEKLKDYEKKSVRANVFEGSLTPIYDAISMMGTVVILYFGAKNVTGTGWTEWNIANFTTFLACFVKLATKTSHAAKLFNAIQKARVSWDRIRPLMKYEPDTPVITGPEEAVELEFSNVSCAYSDTAKLENINFIIKPGEIIGITGAVASGKSMLGKVLIDQLAWQGNIRLGGKDFAKLSKEEKHSYITYMGHEPELLSMSIKDNVTLGDNIDTDFWLKAVCMDDDTRDRGTDAMAGEAGTQLSGGQQARLALARTLAHARSVLVLDDPLAAVDKDTETIILQNIRETMHERVILLISHRLYHFPEMDHVLFIHDGTAEFSDHRTLMETQPEYAALYNRQVNGGDLDD